MVRERTLGLSVSAKHLTAILLAALLYGLNSLFLFAAIANAETEAVKFSQIKNAYRERGQAGSYQAYSSPRFTLYIGTEHGSTLRKHPVVKDVAQNTISVLDETYEEISRIFGRKPESNVVLRFLSPDEFREETGAPSWTSAMFYRGEITIPLAPKAGINLAELRRAIRHEYTHAVIAELSNYRCPAWLDEGLAQLIEGEPNPLLGPSLRRWIGANDAMPLEWLQNGFTALESDIVPAAYGQSLFATRSLINRLGFSAVISYLDALKADMPEKEAFLTAFGSTEGDYEKELTTQMQLWSRSSAIHP